LSLANSVLTFGVTVSFAVAALSVSVVSLFGAVGTDLFALFSSSTISSASAAVRADLGGQLVVVWTLLDGICPVSRTRARGSGETVGVVHISGLCNM